MTDTRSIADRRSMRGRRRSAPPNPRIKGGMKLGRSVPVASISTRLRNNPVKTPEITSEVPIRRRWYSKGCPSRLGDIPARTTSSGWATTLPPIDRPSRLAYRRGAKDDARGVIVLVMVRDTDVIPRGSSLKGLTILLGIAGGIAAVESVRLARELRRHGASLRIVMTTSAQSILRPKALEWASQEQVITAWDPALKQLDDVDGLLIAPATRNLMASHLHGMMSSPLLMAMSVADDAAHRRCWSPPCMTTLRRILSRSGW